MSAAHPAPLQKGYAAGPGDRRLRASVLFAVAAQSLFLVFLTVFLFNHADPKGDGMEMVVSGAAFMLIFMPSACRRSFWPRKGGILWSPPFSLVLPRLPISPSGSRFLLNSASSKRRGRE